MKNQNIDPDTTELSFQDPFIRPPLTQVEKPENQPAADDQAEVKQDVPEVTPELVDESQEGEPQRD